MVLMIEPIDNCLKALKKDRQYDAVIYMSPDGELFNQKAAEALTADPKTADNAKRLFMTDPDKALQMTLKGPAQDQQAYTEAFNKVFGA